MRALSLQQPGRLVTVEVPEPRPPAPDEALVRVASVGVCGTDLHAFLGDQPMIEYPVVLGHELAVEVLELGPEARGLGLEAGERCAVIPYLACGNCGACRRGRSNCCERLAVLGVQVDGGLRERFTLPARLLLPGNDLDDDRLALTEMLAIGAHAVARAKVEPTDTVAVVGVGPIGLGVLAAASVACTNLVGIDRSVDRLRFMADRDLATPVQADDRLTASLREVFGGELPTVVFDATGSIASMQAAPDLVAPGGRVVLVGHTRHPLTFANPTIHRKELTILASRNATREDFEGVLRGMRSGATDPRAWITHRTDLHGALDEFPGWARGQAGLVKALVDLA